MVYPANKETYVDVITDDTIPSSGWNAVRDFIERLQDLFGHSGNFMTLSDNLNLSDNKIIYLNTAKTFGIRYDSSNNRYELVSGGTVIFSIWAGFIDHHFEMKSGETIIRQDVKVTGNLALETGSISGVNNINCDRIFAILDLENVTAGEGLILKTPDGTKRFKITVDNSGVIVSTLVV